MIKNYFKIAWRNLLKNRGSFIINIVGLSTGLACVILIFLWVQSERSVDKFHEKDGQLFQVMEVSKANDQVKVSIATQGLLAETMAKELPEVEAATTFFSLVNEGYFFNLKTGNSEIIKSGGVFADERFFEMFSYKLLSGTASQVLKNKSSAVISRSLAASLFGKDENPINKTFEWEIIGKKVTSIVSGVFEDVPAISTQKFDFVLTKAALFDLVPNFKEWYNEGTNTFLQLKKGTDIAAFNLKIKDFVKKHSSDDRFTAFVRPYSSGYLYGNYENGIQSGGRIGYVKLFSIIGLFILFIACINFMNLSTANASKREKEIGIKKALGATRRELIIQFLTESILTSIISLLVAVLLVWLLIPQFNNITGKNVSLSLSPLTTVYLFFIAIVTGIVSGAYPAFYLSGMAAISVLKRKIKTSYSELFARKGLVVFQFVISLFLIISVLVIYQQVRFIQTMNLGYDKDNVLYIDREGSLMQHSEEFLHRVRNLPGIVDASAIIGSIAQATDNATTAGIEWEGKTPNQAVVFAIKTVDYNLIETLGMSLKEGRSFSKNFGDERQNVILNETAVKAMGLKDPVGKSINMWGENKTIIGITKDFFSSSIHDPIAPTLLRFEPTVTTNFVVKIKRGNESKTLASLESLYKKFNPGYGFAYTFLDEKYQLLYAAEQRVTTLSRYFAGLAILISCLGLFGLALFNAQMRAKEIGIRKVLGASVPGVVFLLSKDFLKLAFIAVFISFPISWWAMNKWLDNYVYKTQLNTGTFVLAFVGMIALTILTVSYQAIKAAVANPVESLRTE